jgi:oxaloacetate decarboxylase gamma subunit
MTGELILQGVELMLLGMTIVFGFLILLVFTLRGMSLLADRLETGEVAAQPAAAGLVTVPDDRQLVAAIATAVARYRANRDKRINPK